MPVKKIVKTVAIEVEDGFSCDRCGHTYSDMEQGTVIRHRFGYHSERDGDEFEAVICEDCLIKLAAEWQTAILRSNVAPYDGAFASVKEK
jgi:hypothetical protein